MQLDMLEKIFGFWKLELSMHPEICLTHLLLQLMT